MDRYVIMVDAGYLLRQAVDILSDGVGTDRRDVDITDYPGWWPCWMQAAARLSDFSHPFWRDKRRSHPKGLNRL